MEDAVEAQLRKHRVSFRRTQHAESIEGFDQAPDFIIPDEWNPRIVIEAKSAEDDGTARDKVTRIQHLAAISANREAEGVQTRSRSSPAWTGVALASVGKTCASCWKPPKARSLPWRPWSTW